MKHLSTLLENGLRVVSVPLPYLHCAEIAIYVKAGARNDPPDRSGLSHFLEHMLFRGTEEYPTSLDLETAFEELGGSVNAATDTDTTCFYAHIHPDNIAAGIEILSSMFLRPTLNGIELERRIISEEALEDINQEGTVTSPDLVMGQLLWPNHPLSGSTVGTLDHISQISEHDLRRHLADWYAPNNAVLVVAGPHDHDIVVKAASKAFNNWHPVTLPVATLFVPGDSTGPKAIFVPDSDSQLTMQLAFHAFRREDPQITHLKVLRRLLAGGGCSRLHLTLREQLGLIYSVESSIGAYDETGCLTIDMATAPENLQLALTSTVAELDRLCNDLIPERELNRVKTAYIADLDYSRDSVTEMGTRYGWGTLMGVVRDIDEDQRDVSKVTAEALQATARLVFRAENRHLVIIGPVEGVDQHAIKQLLNS
jgi:predicted Zn-dependent peptidase